ncbi:MAG TPA: C39 family peptidase, partial [Candidatus Babeliales bacterium]|nr:C39 family peptidase [Candidatus Babeliales bacterium]
YQKVFTEQELTENTAQKSIIFAMDELNPFNQLVFTWNAFRPAQGYYSFSVQARDAKTKKWSQWYKMMEWGANTQRSFLTKGSPGKYEHVRLELGNHHADAFRIKAVACEGATLANMKAIFVSLSDFHKFNLENAGHVTDLPSIVISNVPKKSQMLLDHPRNNQLCSPTSCSMLISYLMGQDIDPVEFAEKAFDTGLGAYGSWPFNMAHAFERCKGDLFFATARMNSFANLHQRLQKGIPVVVSVRGYLEGAPKEYNSGHLLMVIGYDADNQRVICHDPAFNHEAAIVQQYDLRGFLDAWERSHRLAYLAEPAQMN